MDNVSSSVFADLVASLASRGQTLSAAESLTAGGFCASIAAVPGASQVLRGGLVTYATECKHLLADVPQDVLEQFGPVAGLTAQYMAFGALGKCQSDWAVSLTGVAGPTEQDGHPVGEVWCAIAHREDASAEDCSVVQLDFNPALGRNGIRQGAAERAAALLLSRVEEFFG